MTLSAQGKAALQKVGLHLSGHGEAVAAKAEASGIDWTKVVQEGIDIVVAILTAFGLITPAPAQAKPVQAGCCDHCDCCCKCIKTWAKLGRELFEHLCQCHDECAKP